MAPLVRTGGSRHTGLAAPPHRNIHIRLHSVFIVFSIGICEDKMQLRKYTTYDCGYLAELFIFIKCVTIKLAETNYIAKKVNV